MTPVFLDTVGLIALWERGPTSGMRRLPAPSRNCCVMGRLS